MIFARKMPEFYIKIARKFFSPNFRGHVPPSCPLSHTPMSGNLLPSVCARYFGCRRSRSSSLASRRRGPTGGHTGYSPLTSWTPSIDCCTISCDTDLWIGPHGITASWIWCACRLNVSLGHWMEFTWTRNGIGSSCPTCCRSTVVRMLSDPHDILQHSQLSHHHRIIIYSQEIFMLFRHPDTTPFVIYLRMANDKNSELKQREQAEQSGISLLPCNYLIT